MSLRRTVPRPAAGKDPFTATPVCDGFGRLTRTP